MRNLIAGVAALALATGTAYAAPGGGQGKDHANHGGGQSAERGPSQGGGNGKGNGGGNGPPQKAADRGPAMQADRGPAKQAARMEAPVKRGGPDKADIRRADKAQGNGKPAKAERAVRQADNGRFDARPANGNGNRGPGDLMRQADRRSGPGVRVVDRPVYITQRANYGLLDGCPPGLAKKYNGCTPPGLERQRSYAPQWWGYNAPTSGRYYYDDGYLYRTGSNGSILGYLPLLGGALAVGNPWPSSYQPVPVPEYYADYYNLGPQGSYRYADDVLYRVDPQTDMISSIAALLTGDQFGIGQRMPGGYDVYNVPYAYQDQYYDTPEANYRYADGYVYQVDPTTQLIETAIQLLT